MTGSFDVVRFFQQRGIKYIEKGVNVKRDEVNISCPFCNSSRNPDPSYHLGVIPSLGYWSCWRNKKHRGKRLHRLIMKLLNIGYHEACQILGIKKVWLQEDVFDHFAKNPVSIFNSEVIEQEVSEKLALLEEFKPFTGFNSSKIFLNYLVTRGFPQSMVNDLVHEYSMHYCYSGKWQNRVILPIFLDGELVTWTGRSIAEHAELRYRSLSEKEGALISIKDTVFNFDALMDVYGKVLFVGEGPFDAIKVDFYGKEHNVRSTCLFSKNLRLPQAVLLGELSFAFDKVVFLLDSTELDTSLEAEGLLAFVDEGKVDIGVLPEGKKDPGELNRRQVYQLFEKYGA